MPAKNTIKQFETGGYYHAYNRGVEKRNIFSEEKDYAVFLNLLKEYLLSEDHPGFKELKKKTPYRNSVNCFADVELLAFCLMPNHFHLLIKQLNERGMSKFMKALISNYSNYFNKKVDREGSLFQGVYKATKVENDAQLLHVSRYIHKNPLPLLKGLTLSKRVKPYRNHQSSLTAYSYSSYPQYLGLRRAEWLRPGEILNFFAKTNRNPRATYQYFVEQEREDLRPFNHLLID